MNLQSIRWKLPLSYAGVAFLAVVCLGIVLVTVLRGYYAGLEHDYLEANAHAFGMIVGVRLQDQTSPETLDDQLKRLSFLSETRIVVFDAERQVLADSGSPSITFITLSPDKSDTVMFENNTANPDEIVGAPAVLSSIDLVLPTDTVQGSPMAPSGTIAIVPPGVVTIGTWDGDLGVSFLQRLAAGEGLPGGDRWVAAGWRPGLVFGASHTPFGFTLNENLTNGGQATRSDQTSSVTIVRPDGSVLGYLNVSEGPSYGSDIVNNVAVAWLLAGSVAVLLAAIAGWIASRKLSASVVSLTRATERMASGDLTARTAIARRDEIGTLSSSFNTMAERIENTVTTLRRFVADAAHELNTPLTALRTNLELCAEANNPAAARRALVQFRRLETLVSSLLDLSRIEAQTDSPVFRPVDLRALVCELGEVYASRAEQNGVDLALDVPDSLPSVKGDAGQLQCMLGNLMDNAVKFTPAGGSVQVRLVAGADHVEIVVNDTGIGIPPGDLPQLFERFRRGTNAAAYAGSGLGLAIVRAIVRAHGGTVRITSSPGATAVTVSLPAAAERALPLAG